MTQSTLDAFFCKVKTRTSDTSIIFAMNNLSQHGVKNRLSLKGKKRKSRDPSSSTKRMHMFGSKTRNFGGYFKRKVSQISDDDDVVIIDEIGPRIEVSRPLKTSPGTQTARKRTPARSGGDSVVHSDTEKKQNIKTNTLTTEATCLQVSLGNVHTEGNRKASVNYVATPLSSSGNIGLKSGSATDVCVSFNSSKCGTTSDLCVGEDGGSIKKYVNGIQQVAECTANKKRKLCVSSNGFESNEHNLSLQEEPDGSTELTIHTRNMSVASTCLTPEANNSQQPNNKAVQKTAEEASISRGSTTPFNKKLHRMLNLVQLSKDIQTLEATTSLNHTVSAKSSVEVCNPPPVNLHNIDDKISASPTKRVKLSPQVKRFPNRFLSSPPHDEYLTQHSQSTPRRKTVSRRISNTSPMKYFKNNQYTHRHNDSRTAKRKLNFDDDPDDDFSQKHMQPSTDRPQKGSDGWYISYKEGYANNFILLLIDVLFGAEQLFTEDEKQIIINFTNMKADLKKLYIRMLGRKAGWFRVRDIKYTEISTDIAALFYELENHGFVLSDYESIGSCMLDMLKVPELKSVCKSFGLTDVAKPKQLLIDMLLQYVNNQQSMVGSQGLAPLLRKRVRDNLGHCVTLCPETRKVFDRVMLLFSLVHQPQEEDRGIAAQLFLLHSVDIGGTRFPEYEIRSTMPIFTSREQLLRFEEARMLDVALNAALANKQWEEAQQLTIQAHNQFVEILRDDEISAEADRLPQFLRKFTAGSSYAYSLTWGVDCLKKSKGLLPRATEILENLLEQDVYLPYYRGRWYEKLSLLYCYHLKQLPKAAEVVIKGLRDKRLNEVARHTLSSRGRLISKRQKGGVSKDIRSRLCRRLMDAAEDPPVITIKAKSFQDNVPGRKALYKQNNAAKQEITISSVEEFAIEHYRSKGFSHGIHAEGSLVVNLFGLYFWDVIYDDSVPNVFHSRYQRKPLDLKYEEFYLKRKEAIDAELQHLTEMNLEDVETVFRQKFLDHQGIESVVNWSRFQSVQQVVDLVKCMGVSVLAKICERLAKNFRMTRSGFPDLVLWAPDQLKCKFVEVKGPGDTLAIHQTLWLHYLKQIGADVEVCHVEKVGSKKLLNRDEGEEEQL